MVPHPIKFVKMLKQNTLCLEVAGALRTLTALAAELPSDFSGSADCHLKQVVEKKKQIQPLKTCAEVRSNMMKHDQTRHFLCTSHPRDSNESQWLDPSGFLEIRWMRACEIPRNGNFQSDSYELHYVNHVGFFHGINPMISQRSKQTNWCRIGFSIINQPAVGIPAVLAHVHIYIYI